MHTPVTIAKSTIPNLGNGMIAKKDIKKGEVLADYTIGTKKMTPTEFRAAYPNGRATHVWAPKNQSVYYDAKDAVKSAAGTANIRPTLPGRPVNGITRLLIITVKW